MYAVVEASFPLDEEGEQDNYARYRNGQTDSTMKYPSAFERKHCPKVSRIRETMVMPAEGYVPP